MLKIHIELKMHGKRDEKISDDSIKLDRRTRKYKVGEIPEVKITK